MWREKYQNVSPKPIIYYIISKLTYLYNTSFFLNFDMTNTSEKKMIYRINLKLRYIQEQLNWIF